MKIKRFVLWSGGADSTYLIWKSLQEGYAVTAGYAEIMNNEDKTKMELAAISRLLPYFEWMPDFKYLGVVTKTRLDAIPSTGPHLWQVPSWIFATQFMMHDYDECAIGYVMNDDAISYLDDIEAIFNSYKAFYDQGAKLVFPLSKINKKIIMSELPKDMKDLTVWCEMPKINEESNLISACGRCHSCKRQKEYRNDRDFAMNWNIPAEPESPMLDTREAFKKKIGDDIKKTRAEEIIDEKLGKADTDVPKYPRLEIRYDANKEDDIRKTREEEKIEDELSKVYDPDTLELKDVVTSEPVTRYIGDKKYVYPAKSEEKEPQTIFNKPFWKASDGVEPKELPQLKLIQDNGEIKVEEVRPQVEDKLRKPPYEFQDDEERGFGKVKISKPQIRRSFQTFGEGK